VTPFGVLPAVAADDGEAHLRARRELSALYATLAPPIHRFLRDLLRDEALAADATQETFVRAFARLDVLRDLVSDPTRARPWLFGVARNVSLELRRARHRMDRVMTPSTDAIDARAEAPRSSPEGACLERESARIIDRALAQLSEDRRSVLLLRLDHDLAYDDIAKAMGWSLAKVKVELHRAREVLRSVMDDYERGAR
jgi:RNA polymerase sigma-70 factor (ECF subfamily)